MSTVNGTGDDHSSLIRTFFTEERLIEAFDTRISVTPLRGIDRVSPALFNRNMRREISTIRTKCADGSYRFAPYLEILQLKARDKPPRALAIPTVRDRLVLHQLKEILHDVFPECVGRRLPNQYIREIAEDAKLHDPSVAFVKVDVELFYDSIDHERLFALLGSQLPADMVRLLERAIRNPTVAPRRHKKSNRRLRPISKGVPQGLSISNILAEIYMREIDAVMATQVLAYYRYVDDILMFARRGQESRVQEQLSELVSCIKLALNDQKLAIGGLGQPCDYLGYQLQFPGVTVKPSNVDRLIDSLAGHFTRYRHSAGRFGQKWLDASLRERLFLAELNDRISGAVSEGRRYGWIFYFIEIDDLSLLFRLDHIVRDLWRRFMDSEPPPHLKRFVRTYFEARYNLFGGYIRDYDRYETIGAKLAFLVERGHIDPDSQELLADAQVEQRFRRARFLNLARLEADVGTVS